MRGLRRWAGYAALNRPLTILGVERRGFLLIATLGLVMWNAMASLVTGGVVFAVGYGAGWLAGLNLSAKVRRLSFYTPFDPSSPSFGASANPPSPTCLSFE